MPINRAQARYAEVLLSRARQGRYPSHHILDRAEAAITDREMAEAYLDVILDEAETQRHPSLRMLDRADGVIRQLVAADVVQALRERQDEEGDD